MSDPPRFCATQAARTSRNGDRPLIPATRRSLLHTLRQNPTGRPQDSLRKATFLKWSGCRHVALVPAGKNATSPAPNRRSSPLSSVMKPRSEEHTSELQSHHDLVCRLLLEKKNTQKTQQC